MSKKKKKKGLLRSRFYQIYFIVLAAALLAIAVFTVWLMGYLRELESAQPVYVAQQVASLFENGDYADLYRLDSSAEAIAEGDRDFYVQNLEKLARGKEVAWSEAFSDSADEQRYNVTLDGDRFASFTLVPSGQTTRRGHRLWTLGSVQTHVAVEAPEPEPTPEPELPKIAVRVTAPQGYAVALDGEPLSEANAAVTEKPLYEEGFLPEGVAVPIMVTYDCETLNETPEIAVTDASGNPVSAIQTDGHAWSCSLPEDETLKVKYSESAYTLGQKIARYTSRDASRNSILAYCASRCPARKKFKDLSNTYATPHSSYSFQNPQVSEFYMIADGCFTCRVTFDYLLKTKAGTRTDETTYIFCFVAQSGKPKLYNLLMG